MTTPVEQPAQAPFEARRDGRKWHIYDLVADEVCETCGTFKTRRLAEQEIDRMLADLTPQPDPANVAELVDVIEQAIQDDKDQAEPEAEPEGPSDEQIAAMDRTDRLVAAKAEVAVFQEWLANGAEGTPPATPVRDWMAGTPRAARPARKPNGERKTHEYTPEQLVAIKAIIQQGRTTSTPDERPQSWAKIAERIEAEGIPTARGGKWYDTTASDLARKLGLA